MQKSQLQELCQKRGWGLPEYTTKKHGLDHSPSFSATVSLNDTSFHTLSLSKSSRDAQNEAANLALDHFNSLLFNTPPVRPPSSSFPQPSLLHAAAGADDIPPQTPSAGETAFPAANLTERLYKSQLQIYAQKRNITFPVYSSDRVGPPHASRFKCSVAVDGRTFHCPDFFSTLKEAEHAAANLALSSLSSQGELQCDDSAVYKNLLQEIVQKEGMMLPTYDTRRSGDAHSPVFLSSVEVNGESFSGGEAKTKKQAEIIAAKVAYNALKGKLARNPISNPPPTPVHNPSNESLGSTTMPVDDSSSGHRSSTKIALAHKNVTVYPATKQVPRGSTLLPICDHNWNAFFCPPEPKC